MKFTTAQAGKITAAIKLGIRKASSKAHADVRDLEDDIAQSVWCKFLAAYDPKIDATYAGVRANRVKDESWHDDTDVAFRPEALAYRISYTVTIDYLRNKGGKLRYADNHTAIDPISADDDDGTNLGEVLPSKAPSAFAMLVKQEQATDLLTELMLLSSAQRDAIMVDMSEDRALTGSERIAKMRGLQNLREGLILSKVNARLAA